MALSALFVTIAVIWDMTGNGKLFTRAPVAGLTTKIDGFTPLFTSPLLPTQIILSVPRTTAAIVLSALGEPDAPQSCCSSWKSPPFTTVRQPKAVVCGALIANQNVLFGAFAKPAKIGSTNWSLLISESGVTRIAVLPVTGTAIIDGQQLLEP